MITNHFKFDYHIGYLRKRFVIVTQSKVYHHASKEIVTEVWNI